MRRHRLLPVALQLVVLTAIACASAGGGSVGGTSNELSAGQLQAGAPVPDETLYQSLIRLRPQWLVAPTGQPEATVFIDGVNTGSLSTLQVIAARAVASVRYLGAQAAGGRYGSAALGSVIDVTLLR